MARSVERHDGAAVWLAGFARVATFRAYTRQATQALDPEGDRRLITGKHGRLILCERPLHGRENPQHLLFAYLHRSAQAVVRRAVRNAVLNNRAAPEYQSARLGPA